MNLSVHLACYGLLTARGQGQANAVRQKTAVLSHSVHHDRDLQACSSRYVSVPMIVLTGRRGTISRPRPRWAVAEAPYSR
jgi:hypothetical protein